MLCDTCRFSERPGFVRARGRRPTAGEVRGHHDEMVPCPDCGGQGIGHCCDGICEQPDTAQQAAGTRQSGP